VTYLLKLTARLEAGLARLPEELRARHAAYLRSAQNGDGGFSGREGGSDLYYTGFALRGLAVLGALSPDVCDKTAGFLRQSLTQQASVVDFFSLLYACALVQAGGGPDVLAGSPADWPERVAATLETFRTPDGGYAKAAGSISGSTYHTFLVGLCYQLLGRPFPAAEEVIAFIRSRHREDGGYVELAPMRRSGTNPTAAAVGVFQLVGASGGALALTPDAKAGVIDFLAAMPSVEGGLRANGRIPAADLLSTFTGAWTLDQLGALDRIDRAAVHDYGRTLEQPQGGFRGGLWDERSDVEYTFYGLGVLGLLAAEKA
jgi:geranylgeranyl transferase type-2 subunit beta